MDSKSLPDGWLDGEIELTAFALANPDCDVRAVLAGFAALVRRNDQIEAGGDVRVGPERALADYYRRALTPPFAVARRAGKYYGTLVLDSEGTEVLKFWSAEGEPSSRERAYFGEWTPEKWRDYLSDSHWECEGDLAAAEAFVAIVNADLEVGDIRVGPPEQNLEMDERAIRRLQAQWRDPDCTGWTCPHCGRVTNYKPDTECDDCGFDITETVRVELVRQNIGKGVMPSDSETPQRDERTRTPRLNGAPVATGVTHPADNTSRVGDPARPQPRPR